MPGMNAPCFCRFSREILLVEDDRGVEEREEEDQHAECDPILRLGDVEDQLPDWLKKFASVLLELKAR